MLLRLYFITKVKMYLKTLLEEVKIKNINIIFIDYFDTIVHRNIHPNYALRLWAKFMIRELGLDISIDELYFIRLDSVSFLNQKHQRNSSELPYHLVVEEIYKRLLIHNYIKNIISSDFANLSEKIDVKIETNVQYKNQGVVNFLKEFKESGGKVYLVSDFHLPKLAFIKMLKHHNLYDIFDGIYSSSSVEKSKERGTIYDHILFELSLKPDEVMMIGDNKNSDVINSKKNGLHSYLLPHGKYLKRNNRNRIGNDSKKFTNIINRIHKKCQKNSSIPYTEYIIFYHFFIERLYNKVKKDQVKELFFLAREGQYLKRLFDSYQDYTHVEGTAKIKTHYLKISRQASLQINLKDIEIEEFQYLKKNYPDLSFGSFLRHFNCPEEVILKIGNELKINIKPLIQNFFTSDEFLNLKSSNTFISYYNTHRATNRLEFQNYFKSFQANIQEDGIHLVDIGWRGTMQECLFEYFNEELSVTGYYLGLREIFDIQEKTKRYGLIFSILPYTSYYDYLLLANRQLYEQFSAANHGSAICYTSESDGYVIESFKNEEKMLYDHYIREHQDQMFEMHKALLDRLEYLCYDQNMAQRVLADQALITGLFVNNKKLKYIDTLSSGFFQNIGENNLGLTYEIEKNLAFQYLKSFLITPEVMFLAITKLKPIVFKRNKLLAYLFPSYLIYVHYKCNKYIRFRLFNRHALLKYQLFRNNKNV